MPWKGRFPGRKGFFGGIIASGNGAWRSFGGKCLKVIHENYLPRTIISASENWLPSKNYHPRTIISQL